MTTRKAAQTGINPTWLSVCLVGVTLPLLGCSMTGPKLTNPSEAYRRALDETKPEGAPTLTGAEQEQAIARLIALFADYSQENLSRNIRNVYAEELFFRDGFKQFTKVGPLETYMIHSTKPLRSCTFDFEPAIISGPDVYLRWIMNVNLKRDKDTNVVRVIGMSHVRFNPQGKVVFQQDYWDPTDVLYRRIPLANWLIGKVKARM